MSLRQRGVDWEVLGRSLDDLLRERGGRSWHEEYTERLAWLRKKWLRPRSKLEQAYFFHAFVAPRSTNVAQGFGRPGSTNRAE